MTELAEWPDASDTAGWETLANYAMQLHTLETDLAENARWAETMRELLARRLPYDEFTEARMEALRARLRRRKLEHSMRYKYGFKARRARLVRAYLAGMVGTQMS